MNPLLIIFLLACGMACKSAVDDVKSHYRKSRSAALGLAAKGKPGGKLSPAGAKAVAGRHALGWWARELAHGLPVITGGLQAGWHAHRATAQEMRGEQVDAKTRHIEGRASLADKIRDHRARQAAALARIKGEPPAAEADPAAGESCCSACGHPGRPGDELLPTPDGWNVHRSHFDDPSSGFYRPPANSRTDSQPGSIITLPASGPAGTPTASPNGRIPSMPGTPAAVAELTYDQLQAKYTRAIARQEARLAELRVERWKAIADDMTGTLRDGNTVGNLHAISDSIDKEIKQASDTLESLIAAKAQLKHDHGGMNEAHQNAPVKGADPNFYEG